MVSVERAGFPLANRASFRLELTSAGTWLAEDPDIECHAEGATPSDAVAALLSAESEYLAILRGEDRRSPLMSGQLGNLESRLG